MTKLKPCPFCGAEPVINKIRRAEPVINKIRRYNPDGTWTAYSSLPDTEFKWGYHVKCPDCWTTTGPWMKTRNGAINKWNTRK